MRIPNNFELITGNKDMPSYHRNRVEITSKTVFHQGEIRVCLYNIPYTDNKPAVWFLFEKDTETTIQHVLGIDN